MDSGSNDARRSDSGVIPFFLGNGRAMVSLGPLSPKKYCTYSCPFCYVKADFSSYASLDNASIIKWLRARRGEYDIVYISGDTDSFAPPRTSTAVELVEALAKLDIDILFTTRAVMGAGALARLRDVALAQRAQGRLLVACVSISQLHHPELEPAPIPSPRERMQQLAFFHKNGFEAVLAMRPILPHIASAEYIELLESAEGCCHLVLGEEWYVDTGGELERAVFGDSWPATDDVEYRTMDFDMNTVKWKVYRSSGTVRAIKDFCGTKGIPFYMRSKPAIADLRRLEFGKGSK